MEIHLKTCSPYGLLPKKVPDSCAKPWLNYGSLNQSLSSVQFSSVYYLSSNTGTSLKIKNELQINLYE